MLICWYMPITEEYETYTEFLWANLTGNSLLRRVRKQ
jgi:hypothetical protein